MFGPIDTQSGPGWTLYHDDCRARLAKMPVNSIDAITTDPPYHLTSVVKRMGADNAAPVQYGTNGAYRRAAAGFMGKRWDGGDVAFQVETWAAAWRVLKPGGYLFAFSGSRTFHRMVTAIEDAGFIIHPLIGWAFGQGFPKAHNLSRAIGSGSPEAAKWQGWFYGGQVRKPALEPICVAQKPFSERNGAANVLRWGVGAVNVDGCRVVGESTVRSNRAEMGYHGGNLAEKYTTGSDLGRWPANLIHDGSPEVLALFPNDAGARAPVKGTEPSNAVANVYQSRQRVPGAFHADSGSAARFFECYGRDGEASAERRYTDRGSTNFAPLPGMRRDAAPPSEFFETYPPDVPALIYCAKAGRADRAGSVHPTVKPQALMRSIIRHGTPPGGVVLDMFAGSGSTLQAARAEGRSVIGIEADAASVVDTVWRMRYATLNK